MNRYLEYSSKFTNFAGSKLWEKTLKEAKRDVNMREPNLREEDERYFKQLVECIADDRIRDKLNKLHHTYSDIVTEDIFNKVVIAKTLNMEGVPSWIQLKG